MGISFLIRFIEFELITNVLKEYLVILTTSFDVMNPVTSLLQTNVNVYAWSFPISRKSVHFENMFANTNQMYTIFLKRVLFDDDVLAI